MFQRDAKVADQASGSISANLLQDSKFCQGFLKVTQSVPCLPQEHMSEILSTEEELLLMSPRLGRLWFTVRSAWKIQVRSKLQIFIYLSVTTVYSS